MLQYLIYVSMAEQLMPQENLVEILDQSRKWNAEHDITGMLIYIEGLFINTEGRAISTQRTGRFMQVLEGSADELDILFEHIQRDRRHHHVTLLQRTTIDERNFESWQMGFKSLSLDEYRAIPNFFELDQSFNKANVSSLQSLPLQMLKSFYYRGTREATLFSTAKEDQ